MAATLTEEKLRLKLEIVYLHPGRFEQILNMLLMIEGCKIEVGKGENNNWEVSITSLQEKRVNLQKVVGDLQKGGILASPAKRTVA